MFTGFFLSGVENELSQLNTSSVITSHLESSVVIWLPRSLGNDAFDIYSCITFIPDALAVCSLFYWAPWVSLSLLLSTATDSVTTVFYPPDSTIDQQVDVTWRWHKEKTAQFQFYVFILEILDEQSISPWTSGGRLSDDARIYRWHASAAFSKGCDSHLLLQSVWTAAHSGPHLKRHLCKG